MKLKNKKSQTTNNFNQFIHAKHHISRKALLICTALLICASSAGTSYATYHFYTKSRLLEQEKTRLIADQNTLTNERNTLQAELGKKLKEIETNNKTIDTKTNQVKELEAKIQSLNQQITDLNKKLGAVSNSTYKKVTPTTKSNTIYDRIQVSDAFKAQVIRALDLIKAHDNYTYGILNTHVEAIYEMSGCGGFQVKRPIYIGNCGYNDPDTVIAALIVHETTHIENVYVKGIYSIGTKEQELPAYQREYDFAAKLSAPQWFLDSIQNQIAYYSTLPK